jgi:hypothetical protein
MIRRLVQSAFQTGYLSVESEGLIRQILAVRGYQPSGLTALHELWQAVCSGQVKREANAVTDLFTCLDRLSVDPSVHRKPSFGI